MPLHFYMDDVVVDGVADVNSVFRQASYLAVLSIGCDFELTGHPPAYMPVNPSSAVMTEFLSRFEHFAAALTATTNDAGGN